MSHKNNPSSLAVTIVQMNPVVGSISDNFEIIKRHYLNAAEGGSDLVVFSELVVTGYPPEDLVLMPEFQLQAQAATEALIALTEYHRTAIIFGNIHCEENRIYNAAIAATSGKILRITKKHHLPNYGIFDEKRLFEPGDFSDPIQVHGWNLGMVICEDMWEDGPVAHHGSQEADIVIAINASPFEQGKFERRLELAKQHADRHHLTFIYVNQMGGQDGIVFDGGSFMISPHGTVTDVLPFYEETTQTVLIHRSPHAWTSISQEPKDNGTEWMYQAMMVGLRDYIEKNHFPGVIIGLSGGIDSCLSAAIAVDALGSEKVRTIMLPSPYTSTESIEDAKACAEQLGISYEEISIEPLMEVANLSLLAALNENHPGTVEENLQSRIRGMLLMAISNATGNILLTTGNKSEMAVGYATLYGDMCGGFNVLKDLYKTQLYEVAAWRNQHLPPMAKGPKKVVIPVPVLTKAPTAELRENQRDQDSLPPYEILDKILYGLIEERKSPSMLISEGYEKKTIEQVIKLLYGAEYKRRQSPPGVKLTPMQFGLDRRYPMTNQLIKELC